MPDFLTHALFAQQLLDSSSFSLKPNCERHANLFRLGSQGPDLLYYIAYTVFEKKFYRIADSIHDKLTTTDALQLLHSLDFTDNDYSFACAYLGGYAAHLCLDEIVHPFIGKKATLLAEKNGYSVHCGHIKFENRIESRHFVETTGHQPCEYLLRGDLPATDNELRAVARFNELIIEEILGIKISQELLIKGISRLPKFLNMLFDKTKRYQKFADNVLKKDTSLRWHFKRDHIEDEQLLSISNYAEFTKLYKDAYEEYLYIVG